MWASIVSHLNLSCKFNSSEYFTGILNLAMCHRFNQRKCSPSFENLFADYPHRLIFTSLKYFSPFLVPAYCHIRVLLMLILGNYCQFIIGAFLLLLVYNKVIERMSKVRDLERTPNTGGNLAFMVIR